MPMHPPSAAFLALLAGCLPRYSALPPIGPEQLWAPLPVSHVQVPLPDGLVVDVAMIDSWGGAASGPGADLPPVVLVHGLSSYMGFWEHQVQALAQDRRVLALDLPGFGASGKPDAPYTPPWYADVLWAWLDALQVPEAVLVGHSMGGQISITASLSHPERVDRLVLSAPAGIETFQKGAADWMKDYWHEERATHAREEELRATFEGLVFNRKDEGVERMLEERVRMAATPSFRGTSVAVSRAVAGMLDHPVAARLGEVQVPTLLIFGTDDRMIPNPVFNGGRTRAVAEAGRDAIPGAQLVLLPGAGHTVHHDDPQGFNEAVRSFLREPRPRRALPTGPR
jgi:pimeloyl-ACP methyl ester carboxylesterase